jgi:hypothetical protein
MKKLMIAALLAGSLSVYAHDGMHGPGGRSMRTGANAFTEELRLSEVNGEDVAQAAARFSNWIPTVMAAVRGRCRERR